MEPTTTLHLKPSETAVLHAASRIYSAYLSADPNGDEEAQLEKSIQTAIKMSKRVDALIKSDGEIS